MHIKQVDASGRIILPTEFRKVLQIKAGTPVAMSMTGNKIEIIRYQDMDTTKSIIERAIKSHYNAFGLPIAACDDEKVFAACGLEPLISGNVSLSADAKDQLTHNYEYHAMNSEQQIPLLMNNNLVIRMLAPLRRDNKPIGAILIVGDVEPFEELQMELRKGVSLLAALIQPQISML